MLTVFVALLLNGRPFCNLLRLEVLSMIVLRLYVVGIGRIPHAVLSKLTHHRDLGIHSEMISDGILNLVRLGVITNAQKVHSLLH